MSESIFSYDVGIGSYLGGTDIKDFVTVGKQERINLDKLALIPGEMAYATVRAKNHAGLTSGTTSSGVIVSPNPSLTVQDGLLEEDVDFQNDPSSISGMVSSELCCFQFWLSLLIIHTTDFSS